MCKCVIVLFLFGVSDWRRVDSVVGEKSYAYAYQQPQYLLLQQDDDGSTPWYTNIQNWFQNIGGGGGDASSEGGDGGDAVADPSGTTTTATKSGVTVTETKVPKNTRLVYLTPASTTVLNPEKRFFLLPDQQKLYGSISGPALNPVYSLQPLLGRSSLSSIVSAEPAVVVPGSNVPSVVPIQPVPAVQTVEQPNLLKSRIDDALKGVNEAPANRVAPVDDLQTRAGVDVDEDGSVVNALPAVVETQQPAVPKQIIVQPLPDLNLRPTVSRQIVEPNVSPAEVVVANTINDTPQVPTQAVVESVKLVAAPSSPVESVVNDVVPSPVVDLEGAKVKRDIVPPVLKAQTPQSSSAPQPIITIIDSSIPQISPDSLPTPPPIPAAIP